MYEHQMNLAVLFMLPTILPVISYQTFPAELMHS